MTLGSTRATFERLAVKDPLWTVLTARDKKNNKWEPEEFFRTGEVEVDAVLAHLDRLGVAFAPGRALDFGCAVGRLTRPLSTHFAEVVGVDISQPFLELARTYNADRPNCSFVLNVEPHLAQLGDDSFDFIYSNITLQHTPPETIVAYVADFVRLLKPRGVAVFQVPGGKSPFDGSLAWLARRLRWLTIAPLKRTSMRMRGKDMIPLYSVPQAELLAALDAAGGQVLLVENDLMAAKGWLSYRYIVTKPGGAT